MPPHSGSGGKPLFLTVLCHIVAIVQAAVIVVHSVPPVTACGPSPIEPLFVFKESGDPPLQEFTNGKLGIVRPSFGRKSLVIAYRYLNGGSFTADEQKELLDALKGKAPEENDDAAVKAWVEGRNEFLKEEEKPNDIYTNREYGGYNFFPNCTRNAFEVALQTLKDRIATYGSDDNHVKTWLGAQDTVFANCAGGAQTPSELGADSPTWLRKDRDYQIAAAHFYSLNFDEARARFKSISADADSPWQAIADYLIARTLVREASLKDDETKKREVYTKAETHLERLVANGGKYAAASKKLLGLVKYHLHPEERVVELAQTLTNGNDDNLRQDLIDYVWLFDRFETRILEAEEQRKKPQVQPAAEEQAPELTPEEKERSAKRERGELIYISFYSKNQDGIPDARLGFAIEVDYDLPEAKVLALFEQHFGRKLTDDEAKQIKATRESQLSYRKYRMNPVRKWDDGGLSKHEGCDYYNCNRLTLDLTPEFLRSDDLSDWILTLQTDDPGAYNHAISKWRETRSHAWMLTALAKAEKSSTRIQELIQAGEKVTRDEPGFATAAYHTIRLKIAMGHVDEARTRLDEILSGPSEVLPVSAQNQFRELRMQVARGLNEFLKSAQLKPIVFVEYGTYGKFSDILESEKSTWAGLENTGKTKEEYERELEERFADLLPWDNRFAFDDATIEIFNRHFPLQLLAEAARNPNLPDYLQRRFVLAAWTRAIVLKNDEVALRIAPDVVKVEPRLAAAMQRYIKARTPKAKHDAALYILLKFPSLSPLVPGGLPGFDTSEDIEYYFEESWWCAPSDTELNMEGEEVPKVVPKPSFLTAVQLETARREHEALIALGDAKPYLGKQVIDWAKSSPADPRVPEALFIAAQANKSYKYGCEGWEHDEKTKQRAETMLRRSYPQSPWTAKLSEQPDN